MQLTGRSVQTLKYFLGQKWEALIAVGVLSFLVAFFESLSALAVYPILTLVFPSSLTNPADNNQLDKVLTWITAHISIKPLYAAIFFLLSVTIIKLVLTYCNMLLSWLTANHLWRKTQEMMISSLLSTDYQFLISSQKGDLAYRVLTAPGFISKTVNLIPLMGVEILKAIMMIGVLFYISPPVTLVLIVVATIYFLISKIVAQNVSYGTGSGRAESAKNQTIHVMNALKGIKAVRLFGVTNYWVGLFVKECKNFYMFARKDTVLSSIPSIILELIYISFLCVLFLFFSGDSNGVLNNVPTLGVFAYALMKIMPSLKLLSTQGMTIMSMMPHVEATYIALNEAQENQAIVRGTEYLSNFSSQIEVKDATFYYQKAEKPAIKNINLTINKGEFIGIVGASGSGKTTLLDLLAGLLRPTSGEILLDNKPIEKYSPNTLSEHIGYVGQETFLFNDSIRENILFGRYGFSESQIKTALKKADMLDFVESLPDGLDFVLADDGMKMSGGQRQRISIARAMLRNPEIIMLDEATSALDHFTEENILQTILRLVRNENKTVIFVTHRVNAIKDADLVVQMQDG
ncbi:MAG: ABC transporter ATP-binding protein, partial [Candidatus Margulisiibacteriota bacterium]